MRLCDTLASFALEAHKDFEHPSPTGNVPETFGNVCALSLDGHMLHSLLPPVAAL